MHSSTAAARLQAQNLPDSPLAMIIASHQCLLHHANHNLLVICFTMQLNLHTSSFTLTDLRFSAFTMAPMGAAPVQQQYVYPLEPSPAADHLRPR